VWVEQLREVARKGPSLVDGYEEKNGIPLLLSTTIFVKDINCICSMKLLISSTGRKCMTLQIYSVEEENQHVHVEVNPHRKKKKNETRRDAHHTKPKANLLC